MKSQERPFIINPTRKEIEMRGKKEIDFGEFLAGLANEADTPTQSTLAQLQAELQAERQARVQAKLRALFNKMQEQVGRLREHRRLERVMLDQIEALKKQANDVVAGRVEL